MERKLAGEEEVEEVVAESAKCIYFHENNGFN